MANIFFVQGQTVNTLGFAGHTVFVATLQHWHYSMKTAIDR